MTNDQDSRGMRFWRLVGIAVAGALLLSSLYAIVNPGRVNPLTGSERAESGLILWSDALCVSALLLGLGSGIPLIFDAGRGLMLPNKMGTSKESRRQSWDQERAKREMGMRVTFALALAALIIGISSVIISLL